VQQVEKCSLATYLSVLVTFHSCFSLKTTVGICCLLLKDPSLECKIKASDALRASFLAHAAEESARKGRVVRIDEHFKMLMEKYRDDPLLYE